MSDFHHARAIRICAGRNSALPEGLLFVPRLRYEWQSNITTQETSPTSSGRSPRHWLHTVLRVAPHLPTSARSNHGPHVRCLPDLASGNRCPPSFPALRQRFAVDWRSHYRNPAPAFPFSPSLAGECCGERRLGARPNYLTQILTVRVHAPFSYAEYQRTPAGNRDPLNPGVPSPQS